MSSQRQKPFTWRHVQATIMLLGVTWYLCQALRSRDREAWMRERSLSIDHTTTYHRVQQFAPEWEQRCRPHLTATNDSWRVAETSVTGISLSRAGDSAGNTLALLLRPTRDAAARLFSQTLAAPHPMPPRVITVASNIADPQALKELKEVGDGPDSWKLRPVT